MDQRPPDGVVGIVAAVTAGVIDPLDVVTGAVERCRSAHAGLNALVQPRGAAALEEASRLADLSPGPLAGVPVSIKECFPIRGMVTSLGLRSRRSALDDGDAEIVTRLRAAGAIVIGKGKAAPPDGDVYLFDWSIDLHK